MCHTNPSPNLSVTLTHVEIVDIPAAAVGCLADLSLSLSLIYATETKANFSHGREPNQKREGR